MFRSTTARLAARLSALALAPIAHAAPLSYDHGHMPDRSYKFEFYAFAPVGSDLSTGDWEANDATTWSGILDCARTDPLIDRCAFRDGYLLMGVHVEGEDHLRLYRLPLQAQLEVAYTPTGGIKRWDYLGDRADFHEAVSDAVADRFRKAATVTANNARMFGQMAEEHLAKLLLGSLQLELPTDGESRWRLTQTPYGLMHDFATVVSGFEGQAAELRRDGAIAHIGWEASAGMNTQSGLSGQIGLGVRIQAAPGSDGVVMGFVAGKARFNTTNGSLSGQEIDIVYERQLLNAMSRRVLLLETWTDAHTHLPGELPGNPLTETP